jgi:hypothetical protein
MKATAQLHVMPRYRMHNISRWYFLCTHWGNYEKRCYFFISRKHVPGYTPLFISCCPVSFSLWILIHILSYASAVMRRGGQEASRRSLLFLMPYLGLHSKQIGKPRFAVLIGIECFYIDTTRCLPVYRITSCESDIVLQGNQFAASGPPVGFVWPAIVSLKSPQNTN